MAFLQWRTVQEMGCVNSIWLQERLKKQVSLSLNLVSRFFFICLVAEKKRKEKKVMESLNFFNERLFLFFPRNDLQSQV